MQAHTPELEQVRENILRILGQWITDLKSKGFLSGSSVMGSGELLSIAPDKISRASIYQSLMKAIEQTILKIYGRSSQDERDVHSLMRRLHQFILDEFNLGDCGALAHVLSCYIKHHESFMNLPGITVGANVVVLNFNTVDHVFLEFSIRRSEDSITFYYDPWLALSDVPEDKCAAELLQQKFTDSYRRHIRSKLTQADRNDKKLIDDPHPSFIYATTEQPRRKNFRDKDNLTLTPREQEVFLNFFCKSLRTDLKGISARCCELKLERDDRLLHIVTLIKKDFESMLLRCSTAPMVDRISLALPSTLISSGLAIMFINAFVYFSEDPEQTAVCSMWLRGLVGAAGALTAGRVLQAPLSTVFAPLAGAIGTLAAPLLVSTISQGFGMGH
jgi:hypothetical protein